MSWRPTPYPSQREGSSDTLSQEKFDSKTNQAPLPSGGDGGGSAGFLQTNHCIGTYIHGFLDNAAVIEYVLRGKKLEGRGERAVSYRDFKEQQYDKLAAHVRQYVDIERIYQILSSND